MPFILVHIPTKLGGLMEIDRSLTVQIYVGGPKTDIYFRTLLKNGAHRFGQGLFICVSIENLIWPSSPVPFRGFNESRAKGG